MRIRPEREFTRILQLGQVGETGETYAIDKKGTLVSNSRFDEDLILLGLLPDAENSHSILNLSARDPGGNMKQGFRPEVRRAELPLTKDAAAAVAGTSGVNVEGYRDYRGVPIVGAWTWLPKYDLGIITEIDYAEAFRPLTILQWAFFSLFVLLARQLDRDLRLHARCRPPAARGPERPRSRPSNSASIGSKSDSARGRWASSTRGTTRCSAGRRRSRCSTSTRSTTPRSSGSSARCRSPASSTTRNTVAIYDYGRTPEGVFYYAMEFLDGIDLQVLVDKYGPQPEGRVRFDLCTATSEEVSALVRRGEVTLGLRYFADTNPDLVSLMVGQERLVVACSGEHRLATRRKHQLRDIAGERWIAFPQPRKSRELFARVVERQMLLAGLDDARTIAIDSLTAQKRLVEAGFGIALLPESSIQEELRLGTLATIDIPVLRATIPIALIHRRHGYLGPAARTLISLLSAKSRKLRPTRSRRQAT